MKLLKIHLTMLTCILIILIFSGTLKANGSNISGDDKTIISLPSIVCGSCVTRIEKALKKVDGVTDYKVDLDGKTATVNFDNTLTSVSALETVITKIGYDANDKKADQDAYDKLPKCCQGK